MTPATMNSLWNSTGRTVQIEGETRTIISRRLCYGGSIQLKLDRPLRGRTSTLFTADPSTLGLILLAENA
tara:strand:+ start:318 stop:527 length:210 start_codon:yes stop_codon:yes gene_type:complete